MATFFFDPLESKPGETFHLSGNVGAGAGPGEPKLSGPAAARAKLKEPEKARYFQMVQSHPTEDEIRAIEANSKSKLNLILLQDLQQHLDQQTQFCAIVEPDWAAERAKLGEYLQTLLGTDRPVRAEDYARDRLINSDIYFPGANPVKKMVMARRCRGWDEEFAPETRPRLQGHVIHLLVYLRALTECSVVMDQVRQLTLRMIEYVLAKRHRGGTHMDQVLESALFPAWKSVANEFAAVLHICQERRLLTIESLRLYYAAYYGPEKEKDKSRTDLLGRVKKDVVQWYQKYHGRTGIINSGMKGLDEMLFVTLATEVKRAAILETEITSMPTWEKLHGLPRRDDYEFSSSEEEEEEDEEEEEQKEE